MQLLQKSASPLKALDILLWLALICLLPWSCGRNQETIVASVNGTQLTLDDLYGELPEGYLDDITQDQKRQFLDRWINGELLYQEALRQGLQRDPLIKEKIRSAEKSILIADLIQRELDKRVMVTEEEARAYYQAHLDDYVREVNEVRASQILVPTLEEATRLREEAVAGRAFALLAEEHSVDPSSDQGGDLGYFAKEDVLSEVATAAFSSSPGVLSPPIKTEFGYHLILVTDKKDAGSVRSFDQVKDEIAGEFSMKKELEELDAFLLELREQSSIKQNLSLLGILDSPADSHSAYQGDSL